MPLDEPGHERTLRVDAQTAPSQIIERAAGQTAAHALAFELVVDLRVHQRHDISVPGVGHEPGRLPVEGHRVALVCRIVRDVDGHSSTVPSATDRQSLPLAPELLGCLPTGPTHVLGMDLRVDHVGEHMRAGHLRTV